MPERNIENLESLRALFPGKFVSCREAFSHIHRGNSIFIGSSCGEPQYLVRELVNYVENSSHSIFGSEVIHVWTLGVAPYADEKFRMNFRHSSFFISDSSRETVNRGLGDYNPLPLSKIPGLFRRGVITIDVALIQLSLPDRHGNMSLGVSVDIVKSAVENAGLVIAQVNSRMPRVHGDTFINAGDVDFIVPRDEPLLEYSPEVPDDISGEIGACVSRIIQDGDTIQVGYGSIPNAVLSSLTGKKDLGVHSEMLTDGIVFLIKEGVVNNSRKTVDRGKTVASFCMGTEEMYSFIDENPSVEFRQIDATNNIFTIASQENMAAINSALQIDLTGQATAESIGSILYSGVGGQTDFMRGAALSRGGKAILTMRSTSNNGERSRIVPRLDPGASCTLGRGDVHYVVTEYGIAYLHAKNIRERAMSLIAIAHPKFRPGLIKEAREMGLIYRDQRFIQGERGLYPRHLEAYRETGDGTQLFLRPVNISDEELLKDFFYSLSDMSLYSRFFSPVDYIPHNTLQNYSVIDYSSEMSILAVIEREGRELVVGLGQYIREKDEHTASASFAVRDDFQGRGIGRVLLQYLTSTAMKEGLLGFTAMVLRENERMLHLFESMNYDMEKSYSGGIYELEMRFRP